MKIAIRRPRFNANRSDSHDLTHPELNQHKRPKRIDPHTFSNHEPGNTHAGAESKKISVTGKREFLLPGRAAAAVVDVDSRTSSKLDAMLNASTSMFFYAAHETLLVLAGSRKSE